MSWTSGLTNVSVRLASDMVKNLGDNDDPLNFFGVGYEADDSLVAVNDHDRSSVVMIGLFGDCVAFQLGLGLHDGRIGSGMILHGTITGIGALSHTLGHHVTVRDRPQVAPVLRVVDDRDDRDVLHAHQGGNL